MQNDSPPFDVFLSHFAEEQAIAEHLQDYLSLVFGEELRVFRSSDDGSIRTGEDQYPAILEALNCAKVYIVLVSKFGAPRPWLNFEVGFGKARGVPIYPVLVRQTLDGDVPTPLAQLQLRPLNQPSVLKEIVEEIASVTGRAILAQRTEWFLAQLVKKESSLPNRRLTLIPFRHRVGEDTGLGFEISYNGPRPLKLVQVWAEVPWDLLQPNWWRAGVSGHLVSEPVTVQGKTYLRREYIANTTPPDPREAAQWNLLHPHLPPSETPKVLKELRFLTLSKVENHGMDERIRCGIVAEEGNGPVQEFRFGDIEVRKDFKL